MKSKAPLALMEMLIMVAVFAFAAALCVSVFVKSSIYSAEGAARDRAVVEAENAAELIRYYDGDLNAAAKVLGGEGSEEALTVAYDADWKTGELKAETAFELKAQIEESGTKGLGKAVIFVQDEKGRELFTIPVAWQIKAGER